MKLESFLEVRLWVLICLLAVYKEEVEECWTELNSLFEDVAVSY